MLTDADVEKLTERQFEIFQLIGKGCSNREIAAVPGRKCVRKTVAAHTFNIIRRLGLKNMHQLRRDAAVWVDRNPKAKRELVTQRAVYRLVR